MRSPRSGRDSGGDTGRRAAAEALAIEALGFLAAEPERLGAFLAMSGIGPGEIRQAAAEPQFLAGVLDHVAADERLLLDFAAGAKIKPDAVLRAATALGGGLWERDSP